MSRDYVPFYTNGSQEYFRQSVFRVCSVYCLLDEVIDAGKIDPRLKNMFDLEGSKVIEVKTQHLMDMAIKRRFVSSSESSVVSQRVALGWSRLYNRPDLYDKYSGQMNGHSIFNEALKIPAKSPEFSSLLIYCGRSSVSIMSLKKPVGRVFKKASRFFDNGYMELHSPDSVTIDLSAYSNKGYCEKCEEKIEENRGWGYDSSLESDYYDSCFYNNIEPDMDIVKKLAEEDRKRAENYCQKKESYKKEIIKSCKSCSRGKKRKVSKFTEDFARALYVVGNVGRSEKIRKDEVEKYYFVRDIIDFFNEK